MKYSLLPLSFLTALAAVFLVPNGLMAATNTASVSVTEDTTLTLTLAGQMAAPTFSVSAYVSQDSHNKAWNASSDYVTVRDYTGGQSGKNGHHVGIALNRATWWYNGLDTVKATRIRVVTGMTVGSDEMLMFMKGSNVYTFTPKDTNLCSENGTTTLGSVAMKPLGGNTDWASTTNTCPGDTKYAPPRAILKVASNGLGNGTYTIAGTITLTDGQ